MEQNKQFSLLREISGALGDLGTFLPHVLGIIIVAGLDPVGIFTMFGLFYIFVALIYRLPVPVQPMKVASAVILVNKITPGVVAGAGITIGGVLTFLGLTGLINRLTKLTPAFVVGGIQLYFGLSLLLLGLKMIIHQPLFGFCLLITAIALTRFDKLPLAVIILFLGLFIEEVFGKGLNWPSFHLDISLPTLIWPSWTQLVDGASMIALPQLALTVTNAIILTSTLAHDLYPVKGQRITPNRLALSQGLGTLIAAPFGGIPMCHGSGGLIAHHRFGSRTYLTPLLLGFGFLFLGIFLGPSGVALLKVVPEYTLGVLLAIGGWELARNANLSQELRERSLAVAIGLICFVFNGAIGFMIGILLGQFFKDKPKSYPANQATDD